MKNKLTLLIIAFTFVLFSNVKAQCVSVVKVNTIEFCMPKIKGFTEVYNNPNYIDLVNNFIYKGYEGLAFYVNSISNVICVSVYSQCKFNVDRDTFKTLSEEVGKYLKKASNMLYLKNKIIQ